MRVRLVLAIVSTVLEVAAIAVIVLLALPEVGVRIPLPALVGILVVWVAWSVFTYKKGSEALHRRLAYPKDMAGHKGTVVKALDPDGLVKIKGELWVGRSAAGQINPGTEVIVVVQEGLKLIVRAADSARGSRPPVDDRKNDEGNSADGEGQA